MSQASPPADAIARELAALGEDAPSAAELALADGGDAPTHALDDDAAVASVARLTELAEPLEFDDLSELEVHRVWRQVEHELAPGERSNSGSGSGSDSGASPLRWLFAAAGLAAAAAVALVVIPRDPPASTPAATQLSAAEVSAQGDVVRSALASLDDGRSDTTRAQDRLAAYQQQLEERGG